MESPFPLAHRRSGTTVGLLSTFPPTRCGLATFTEALGGALADEHGAGIRTVRVMDELAVPGSTPGTSVMAELVAGDQASTARAAAELDSCDVAIIQHEYGIYGGPDGDEVIALMERLAVPVIVVLHTVLETPTPSQRLVLERVASLADAVVVMTAVAAEILERRYDVDASRVVVIAHGVPVWNAAARSTAAADPQIITWGLIGPGKGIEWGIRAMADLRDAGVSAHYTVYGQTHPKVVAHADEAYRESLADLIAELRLEDRVVLDGRYLDPSQLAAAVAEADAVLLPYDSRNQVTSGVLVEALAAGRRVVATEFPHALELLGNGRGRTVAHEDPAAMAAALREVLADSAPAAAPAALSWPAAAGLYLDLVERLRIEHAA
ncbi:MULTISPECIES: glycosyltransferase [unclassified Rathayibacter]|uniref:glycosyltransferase n=2 Tax=Rathayibacter TaxID=33886 RepID=UPI000CE825ED|nr:MULTISPECIES: glycosyltransferase [unclassified Rathayibacter]PPG01324.1 glycosyl transferase family 1 [Rathayibacter sp. AY2B1]PPG66578.1 glycosyl transferase family 1 [Rathayibacter sp. AY1F4]